MTENIILETERMYFRPHILADLDAFCAMEADPDFRRYVGGAPRPRQQAEQRFMNSLKPVTDHLSVWAAIYKPENKYIGRCGIYPHFSSGGQPITGEAALGLYIDKAYWGRGLATEAGRAFINFGFNSLKIGKIVTAIDIRNAASIHIMEKLGFKLYRTEQGDSRSFYHYVLERKR